MFEDLVMAVIEHWEGTTQWERPVRIKLVAPGPGPGNAWRVEWSTGGPFNREVFDGPTMEADARKFLATKQADLGHGWRQIHPPHRQP